MTGPTVSVRKSAHSCIIGRRCSNKSLAMNDATPTTDRVWAKTISAAGAGMCVSPAAQFLKLNLNPCGTQGISNLRKSLESILEFMYWPPR